MPGIGNDIRKWFFPDGFNSRSLSGTTQFAKQVDMHGNPIKLDRSGTGDLSEDVSEQTLNSMLRAWVKNIKQTIDANNGSMDNAAVHNAVMLFRSDRDLHTNPLMKNLRQFLLFDQKPAVGKASAGCHMWIPVGAEVPVTDFQSLRATGIDLVVRDPFGQFIAIELKWGYLKSYRKKADPAKRSEEPNKWLKPPLQFYPVNAERYALIEILWGAMMFDDTYKEKLSAALAVNVNIEGVVVSADVHFSEQVIDLLFKNVAMLQRRRRELQQQRQRKKEDLRIKNYNAEISQMQLNHLLQSCDSSNFNSTIDPSSELQVERKMSAAAADLVKKLETKISKLETELKNTENALTVARKALRDLKNGASVDHVNGFLSATATLMKMAKSQKRSKGKTSTSAVQSSSSSSSAPAPKAVVKRKKSIKGVPSNSGRKKSKADGLPIVKPGSTIDAHLVKKIDPLGDV
jgi:hypothetical protein